MKLRSNNITHWSRSLVEIRPEERVRAGAMFFYFFFTLSLIYILKPVRNALFLGELGARNLRYVYMGEGLFLIFVVAAYIYLSKKIPRKIFFSGILFFFASHLVTFWFLFQWKVPYLSAIFYIWVSSFSITTTTQFWILANDIFNPHEAKRLFGLIISGGSAGGIIGGLATNQAMKWLHAEDMLLIAAAVLVICAIGLFAFWGHIYPSKSEIHHAEKKISARHSGSKMMLASSYLMMLALLVMTAKMASTIIDNQFNAFVELAITGKEARTAFFGNFLAGLNAVSFFMQLIATSFCLHFFGRRCRPD